MNDSELDKKLKAARGPNLEPEYTGDFPRMVLANLRSAPRTETQPHSFWLPRLAWGLATVVFLIIAFVAGHQHGRSAAEHDTLASSKLIDETLAMFPNRVRAIVQDEHGMNLVLSDTPNVPASTPIYVRICDGEHCSSAVTFSGQDVQIAGHQITVLSDSNGGVILEGSNFAWSSAGGGALEPGLRVQAKLIQTRAM